MDVGVVPGPAAGPQEGRRGHQGDLLRVSLWLGALTIVALAATTLPLPKFLAMGVLGGAFAVSTVILVAVLFKTARLSTGADRIGWGLIAAVFAAIVPATGVWVALFGANWTTGGDGAAAAFYVASAVLLLAPALVGMLLLIETPFHPRVAASNLLTGLIIAGSVFFLAWIGPLGTLYKTSTLAGADRIAMMTIPLFDVLFVSMAVFGLSRASGARRSATILLAIAFAIEGILDTAGTYLALRHGPEATLVLSSGYVAMGGFLAASAVRWRGTMQPTTPAAARGWTGLLVPYAPFVLGLSAAAVVYARDGGLDPVEFWTSVLVVCLLVVRQLVVLVDNVLLRRRVEDVEAERLQTLNNLAHDLASGLVPLTLQIGILQQGVRGKAATQQSLDVLGRASGHLERLIADVRELARLEARGLRIERRDLDADDVVTPVVESLRPVARDHGVELKQIRATHAHVIADPVRITQVLSNLVTNAIKFTPGGGHVDISVEATKSDVRFAVRDTGRGLSTSEIPRLFHPFVQVGSGAERETGTGLGLFIAKRIVEGHGGRIGVTSQGRGQGSTFFFTIPQAKPA